MWHTDLIVGGALGIDMILQKCEWSKCQFDVCLAVFIDGQEVPVKIL